MLFNSVKLGQVYCAIDNVKTLGMAIYKAAGSGGFYCTIPKGTKIVIENNPWPWPIAKAVSVIPLNYKQLEGIIVPMEERKLAIYNMYTLVLKFKDLHRYFVKENIKEIEFDDERIQEYWNRVARTK